MRCYCNWKKLRNGNWKKGCGLEFCDVGSIVIFIIHSAIRLVSDLLNIC